MPRYCSHTLILPDESCLNDMIVEVSNNSVVVYYPFAGEVHSTLYIDTPILLSFREDLEGKTVSLNQLSWALSDIVNNVMVYAYRLVPCSSCAGERFTMIKL